MKSTKKGGAKGI